MDGVISRRIWRLRSLGEALKKLPRAGESRWPIRPSLQVFGLEASLPTLATALKAHIITLDVLSKFSICRWDTCASRRSIFWSCFRVNLVLTQKPGFSESADTRDSRTEASRFNSLSTVSRYSTISISASSSMLSSEKKPTPLLLRLTSTRRLTKSIRSLS